MKNKLIILNIVLCATLLGCKNFEELSSNISSYEESMPKNEESEEKELEYAINIPSFDNGQITTNKSKYYPGEKVILEISPNEGFYLEESSLKYNEEIVGNSYSFIMPKDNVNITASFLKDDLPENYIHGLHIQGNGQWNMVMIEYEKPIDLTQATALLVEVKFNEIIEGCHFRLAAMTSDGTVYDAFGSEIINTTKLPNGYSYSCDMDDYNAAARYSWTTGAWGGWSPWWDKNVIKETPTFYVEVPMKFMFSRFNRYGEKVTQDGKHLDNFKKLSSLGIHVTGSSNNNFIIGKTYIRERGIVKQISNPKNYTNDNTSVYKIDPFGIYETTLTKTIYNHVNEFKYNKNMLICGDSIMTRWWTHKMTKNIADNFNANLVRDTIGGTTIKDYTLKDEDSMIEHKNEGLYSKYVEAYGDFDYIIIQRGTNDLYYATTTSSYEQTMGTIDSYDEATVYGSIRTMIEYFHNLCPNAKIVMSNLLYRDDAIKDDKVTNYNQDLKTILSSYDYVSFFDLYNNSGINQSNYMTYLNSSSNPHSNGTSPDNLHPNDEGATVLERVWIEYLKNIFK